MKINFNWSQFIKLLATFLAGLATCFAMSSCGVTKATISKPAEGTQTTITITTNNPISTDVSPTVELNKK